MSAETLQLAAGDGASGLALWLHRLHTVGPPPALGLLTLALTVSPALYLAVRWIWRARIVRAWRTRHHGRH